MLAAGGWFSQGAGAKGAGGKPFLILLGITSCLWSSFQLSHNAVMQREQSVEAWLACLAEILLLLDTELYHCCISKTYEAPPGACLGCGNSQ